MAPTSRVWVCVLLVCQLLTIACAGKPAQKLRLEDIENDNNKKTQESQKAQVAAPKDPLQVPQGGFLPHQFFQFGQQGVSDYSAALQGAAAHPQLYLGQREQLAFLEALGQQPSPFSAAPFHGLYSHAAGHGIPPTGSFSFGPFRGAGVTAGIPPTASLQGAFALPSSAIFGQNGNAKLPPQQAIQPQLQYQQIQQQQLQQVQQLQKVQAQTPQQLQQPVVRQQYVLASQPKQQIPDQQQIAALQQQFAPQQPFFQLPQYLQQLTQQRQYPQQQIQAIQQQAQPPPQFAFQPESPKFQTSQEVKQSQAGLQQQPYFQPLQQQYVQQAPQQYLQQAQQQYVQPGQQQQYLQQSQQELLAARPIFQQPFVYQGGPQPQKVPFQGVSGGNQVLVGFGGNQLTGKPSALAVKREGLRGGGRQFGAATAYVRGGYSS